MAMTMARAWVTGLTLALALVCGPAHADKRVPIVIAAGDSNREAIGAELVGQMLVRAGYRVAYDRRPLAELPADVGAGNVHLVPEVSKADTAALFGPEIKARRVVDLGARNAMRNTPPYRKLAWKGARKRWTGALKLFKNITMPESATLGMLANVDKGQPVAEVVEQWLAANPKRWKRWESASVNWMKP